MMVVVLPSSKRSQLIGLCRFSPIHSDIPSTSILVLLLAIFPFMKNTECHIPVCHRKRGSNNLKTVINVREMYYAARLYTHRHIHT